MSRELRYGIIAGIITMLWMGLGYALGWNESEIGKYAPFMSLIILALCIYITILFKRDRDGGGFISFKDAFVAGLSASFVIGAMVGALLMVYTQYINPNSVSEIIKNTTEYLQKQKATKEEIDKSVESIKAAYSAFGQVTYGIGTTMLTGALITLICAAIMKREKKN